MQALADMQRRSPLGAKRLAMFASAGVGSARDDGTGGKAAPPVCALNYAIALRKADHALHPCGEAFGSIALFERSPRRIDLGKR
jgi:hypothetical protein